MAVCRQYAKARYLASNRWQAASVSVAATAAPVPAPASASGVAAGAAPAAALAAAAEVAAAAVAGAGATAGALPNLYGPSRGPVVGLLRVPKGPKGPAH